MNIWHGTYTSWSPMQVSIYKRFLQLWSTWSSFGLTIFHGKKMKFIFSVWVHFYACMFCLSVRAVTAMRTSLLLMLVILEKMLQASSCTYSAYTGWGRHCQGYFLSLLTLSLSVHDFQVCVLHMHFNISELDQSKIASTAPEVLALGLCTTHERFPFMNVTSMHYRDVHFLATAVWPF